MSRNTEWWGDGYGVHDGGVDMRNLLCSRLSRDSLSQERDIEWERGDNGVHHRDLDIRNPLRCRLIEDTRWQGSDCLG